MIRILYFVLILSFALYSKSKELAFSKGVNLTSWFQTASPQQVQFTKYTKQDFINIKSLGCNVIRLPINLHAMTSGEPNYIVDPLFFTFMDQVVDWAEELQIHLILDNHTFDTNTNTDPNIENALIPVWTQMAGHYKNRSQYIYYEVLNEPHGIADTTWNRIQKNVVTAIRQVDQKHIIVIGPANWNGYNNLQYMPVYADTNLIYTFHFYEPFLFSHQGAGWTDPPLTALAGIPFPYDAANMPALPQELAGTWVQSAYNNYSNNGTVSWVQQQLDIAINFKTSRNIRLYCGELGVYIPNSDNDQRVNWYNEVSSYLSAHGIGWTTWDYQGGFGLFEKGSNELFDYDLNIPLIEALGLTAPPQSDYILQPDTSAFNIYRDYTESGIFQSGYTQGILDFYNQDSVYDGNFCIYWTGASQYNNIGFNFKPVKDFSYLLNNNYAVDFWVKGDSPGSDFDIRFVDTKTAEPDDHPWRMNKTINESIVPWDGTWQHVRIPLTEFTEQGSWDSIWYSPQGDFDWTQIEFFQIVAENQDLTGKQFWFDDIKVVSATQTKLDPGISGAIQKFRLFQNYPNPFNPETTINYELKTKNFVNLTIYDITGKEIKTVVNQLQNAGQHTLIFKATGLPSGLYFYRIRTSSGYSQSRKMILIR